MNFFLSIAASDNSGGAGMQQDMKVARDMKWWGLTVLTGLTTQSFQRLFNIYPVTPDIFESQLKHTLNTFKVSAVKIGAICDIAQYALLRQYLTRLKNVPIVLDPVFAPTSGADFITDMRVEAIRELILNTATVITPNLQELEMLSGSTISDVEDAIVVSKHLIKHKTCAIVLTGGHWDSEQVTEVVISNSLVKSYSKPKKAWQYTHGTGCTFSSALACLLANGKTLEQAVIGASTYTEHLFDDVNAHMRMNDR